MACEDDSGRIDIVFFHAEPKFIERQLPVGEERYVSGRVERYGEKLQMSHPDYIMPPEARGDRDASGSSPDRSSAASRCWAVRCGRCMRTAAAGITVVAVT